MIFRKVTLILFSIFAWNTITFAQLNFENIDTYPELEGTVIMDILPDNQGNIWIATFGGLVKFDGYDFKWFHNDPKDARTIGDLLTYKLYQDSKGRIWIGSMGNIYCYDPTTRLFKTYNLDVDFPTWGQPGVFSIAGNGHGRIYFGVQSASGAVGTNALLFIDEDTDELKGYQEEYGHQIRNVYRMLSDSEGNIILFNQDGEYIIDTKHQLTKLTKSPYDSFLDDEYVSQIEISSDSILWLATDRSRLHSFNLSTAESNVWSFNKLFKQHPPTSFSSALQDDGHGNLIIMNELGIISFSISNKQFQLVKSSEELNLELSLIHALAFDSFDNFWFGTRSGGLVKISSKKHLTSYKHIPDDESSIAEGWVSRMFEDKDGMIYMPTNDQNGFEGLNVLDPAKGIITKQLYRDILPEYHTIYMINELNPGEILFLSERGLQLYDLKSKKVKETTFVTSIDSLFINDVTWDSKGNLWICSFNGLYKEKDGKSVHFDFTTIEGTTSSSNEVTKILESKSNGIWVMTNNGLFFIDYDLNTIVPHGFDSKKGEVFSTTDINSLYEDDNGNLWVGTWQGGLNKYNINSGKIKYYGLSDGLPSLSIQGILGDEENGVLWLSTFSGMSQFFIEEERFINYSQDDGIQGLLYADGSYLKTSEGLFVFGGSNGINIFDPAELAQRSIPPKIHITEFKVGNESYPVFSDTNQSAFEQDIAFDQNNISIEYVGIHFDNASKNRFSFRLKGYENDWRDVGNQRSAYYYNLPHGNYSFEVKSSNSNGVWNEHPASISFSITPPWWLTWWAYTLYGICFIACVFAFDRIQKKRLIGRERRQAQEKELAQAKEIEKAYKDLKATQSQLIQAEKMASLGELTAGIAHEIQNPLNFVNNFSEVSKELIEEMQDELNMNNPDVAREISNDIKQNLDKIHHHGGRASSIVKGMLEHSRTGDQQKSLTDINALAEEYLRLAYHGLRAKDKSFNADFKTEFDDTLPQINVVPQDIGRVILNLINNAFYAVDKKAKSGIKDYKAEVIVSTKKINNGIEIVMKDNGPGIPESIKDKIFQPFFTTKSTGEGTGLGLSLSYDIITKGHNGHLEVETEEGEGTKFIIRLPIKSKP